MEHASERAPGHERSGPDRTVEAKAPAEQARQSAAATGGRGQGAVEHVSERTLACVSERADGNAGVGRPVSPRRKVRGRFPKEPASMLSR